MYSPRNSLLEGLRLAFPLQLFPWDDYFARMAETDWLCGRADVGAVKSLFIRKTPFGGSYALTGGITAALRTINDLRFDKKDFSDGMLSMGYGKDFVEWLKKRGHLRLRVFAPPEGQPIFANEPAVTVIGPLADIRLVEGIITEAMNFPTLSITKWHRLIRTVRPGGVLEFARRRAQDAFRATLYGMLAGCFATSNSEMRRFLNFLVVGTMGHEWVQSFGDVREAFKIWLDHQPAKAVGLIDTKQCLEHDFPIWLDEVYAHREQIRNANPATWGWRNDSGDLAYLTIEQYVRFFKHSLSEDPWFAERMRIVLTNELDEYSSQSIIQQIRVFAGAAGLNAEDIIRRIVWAAGTKPGTCRDQPDLGGVAKLMEVENHACIKLAFDADGLPGIKTSIPGFNRSALITGEDGEVKCLLIYPAGKYEIGMDGLFRKAGTPEVVYAFTAHHPDNPAAKLEIKNYTALSQQEPVFDSLTGDGFTAFWDNPDIKSVPERARKEVDRLHWSTTRLDQPHKIKVSLTTDLFELRQKMIAQGVLRADKLV